MYIVPPRYAPPIVKPSAEDANNAADAIAEIIGADPVLPLALYPILTLALPVIVVAAFTSQTKALLALSMPDLAANSVAAEHSRTLALAGLERLGFLGVPVETLAAIFADAASPGQTAATSAFDLSGRLIFLGVHLMALATSLVALLAGLEVARRFIWNGGGLVGLAFWHGVGLIVALLVIYSGVLTGLFGMIWDPLLIVSGFKQLLAVLALPKAGDIAAVLTVRLTLFAQSAGVAAIVLVITSAMISYRWPMLGPKWYQPADLARQRRWLIGLFVLASILLVFGAATLRAAEDWPAGLIGPDAKLGAFKAADVWTRLASATSTYWGVFSSLALVAAFGPAFVSLAKDIDLAARIGLAAETAQAPAKREGHFEIVGAAAGANGAVNAGLSLSIDPAPAAPAGKISDMNDADKRTKVRELLSEMTYAQLLKWKQDHGLDLATSQIVTALAAAAAPLLASPAIDLSKVVAL